MQIRHRPSARRRARRRGQALVEFALVIPIFLLILAGILDFGVLLFSRMTVINAAREGARVATTMTETPQNIPGAVQARVSAAADGLSVTVTPTCVRQGGSCSFTPTGAKAGDSVKVRVHYDHHMFFPLLFGTSVGMDSTVQMVLE